MIFEIMIIFDDIYIFLYWFYALVSKTYENIMRLKVNRIRFLAL